MKKLVYLLAPLMCFSSLIGCNKPTYTVTWKNWDGTILEVDENVIEGSMPEYNSDSPIKPIDDFYDRPFIGWDKELKEVCSDVEYTAIFDDEGSEVDRFITEIGITVGDGEEFSFNATPAESNELMVDWGDGSEIETGVLSHNYIIGDNYNVLIKNAQSFGRNVGKRQINSLKFGESVETIEDFGFFVSGYLKYVYISKSISFIDGNTFNNCSALETIIVDKKSKYFDSRNDCNAIISKIDLVKGENKILANTLISGCYKTTIPEGVKIIGKDAFASIVNSSFTSVTLPNSVIALNETAFSPILWLSEVHFSKNINYIGERCFMGCPNLSLADLSTVEQPPILEQFAFHGTSSDLKILVPHESLDAYKSADGWKDLNIVDHL